MNKDANQNEQPTPKEEPDQIQQQINETTLALLKIELEREQARNRQLFIPIDTRPSKCASCASGGSLTDCIEAIACILALLMMYFAYKQFKLLA